MDANVNLKFHLIQLKDLVQSKIILVSSLILILALYNFKFKIRILDLNIIIKKLLPFYLFLVTVIYLINLYIFSYKYWNGYMELVLGMGLKRREYLTSGIMTSLEFGSLFFIPLLISLSINLSYTNIYHKNFIIYAFSLSYFITIVAFSELFYILKNKYIILSFILLLLIEYEAIKIFYDHIYIGVLIFPLGTLTYFPILFLKSFIYWFLVLAFLIIGVIYIWKNA